MGECLIDALHTTERLAEHRRTKARRFKTVGVDGSWIETPDVADDMNRLLPTVGDAFERTGAVSLGAFGHAQSGMCGYRTLVDFASSCSARRLSISCGKSLAQSRHIIYSGTLPSRVLAKMRPISFGNTGRRRVLVRVCTICGTVSQSTDCVKVGRCIGCKDPWGMVQCYQQRDTISGIFQKDKKSMPVPMEIMVFGKFWTG